MAKYYETRSFEPSVDHLNEMLDFVDERLDEKAKLESN